MGPQVAEGLQYSENPPTFFTDDAAHCAEFLYSQESICSFSIVLVFLDPQTKTKPEVNRLERQLYNSPEATEDRDGPHVPEISWVACATPSHCTRAPHPRSLLLS